jgi:hypothetical protein
MKCSLKSSYYGMVYLLPCYELTLIKTQTVAQQHLNVGYYDSTRMPVDGMVYLLTYNGQHRLYDFDFGGRKMQCLIGGITEKTIFRHFAPQRCAREELGMEHKRSPFRHHIRLYGHRCDLLPRSNGSDSHFVEIILREAIKHPAPFRFFKKHGINAEIRLYAAVFGRTFIATYGNKRMQSLKAEMLVEIPDRFIFDFRSHGS